MFIWDFVADKILGQIVDWFYSQVVGFLGNFFSEMGSMGAELFEMNWVQSVVLFFSYLGWALFATGLVVAVFECGIEYSAGRGNVKETALNVLKGFLAVSLFTQVPVRLYSLAISLQGTLTAGITGFGSTSIGDAAKAALADLENLESLTESTYPLRGFGRETSGLKRPDQALPRPGVVNAHQIHFLKRKVFHIKAPFLRSFWALLFCVPASALL